MDNKNKLDEWKALTQITWGFNKSANLEDGTKILQWPIYL